MPAHPRTVLAAAVGLSLVVSLLPSRPVAAVAGLEQRYEITATLDVAAGRLDADLTLNLTNRAARSLEHVDLSAVPRALGFFSLRGDVSVDGDPVTADWTTSINLRVPLGELERGESVTLLIPFSLTVTRATDAFTARTSAENGVLSFGQWFPIVSVEHDAHGIGDPQVSFNAATSGSSCRRPRRCRVTPWRAPGSWQHRRRPASAGRARRSTSVISASW